MQPECGRNYRPIIVPQFSFEVIGKRINLISTIFEVIKYYW